MKPFLFLLAGSLLVTVSSKGQIPGNPPTGPYDHPGMPQRGRNQAPSGPVANPKSISLNAREVASKRQDVDHFSQTRERQDPFSNQWNVTSTRSRETFRRKTVEIEIRNMSGIPIPKGNLWIVWIAKANEPRAQPFVYHMEWKNVEATQLSTKVQLSSPTSEARNFSQTSNYGSSSNSSGIQLQGYIIGFEYQEQSVTPYVSSSVKAWATPEKLEELRPKIPKPHFFGFPPR